MAKKKIGTITFHSSYNHGSVLQAYALQEYILDQFGQQYDYQIINLRTKRQKDLYNKPYGFYDAKSMIKKIVYFKYKRLFLKRKGRYETFLKNNLHLTTEYENLNELKKANLNFDFLISGSDQIWNYTILDFDWAFFLEFGDDKAKRLSYAASFGPKPLDCSQETKSRLQKDLKRYSSISVREHGSLNNLKKIMNIDENKVSINADPTLLLDKSSWDKLVESPIEKGDYIFLYDLKNKKEAYDIAKKLSKQYRLPIIVVKEKAQLIMPHRNIKKRYDAGPIEFLNYIKYAKIVISTSFHGNVFSIIFNKPFLAVGGNKDFRINNILRLAKLTDRAISDSNELPDTKTLFNVDFSHSDSIFKAEQQKTKRYFIKALEVKRND